MHRSDGGKLDRGPLEERKGQLRQCWDGLPVSAAGGESPRGIKKLTTQAATCSNK